MNVNNPDPLLMLEDPLTNTSRVDPGRSRGRLDVGQLGRDTQRASGLPTELFVDLRDLITAPQMASYDIWQALLTLDPTTISQALRRA